MLADSLRKSLLQAAIEGKLTQREPGDGDARDLLAEIQKEKARLVSEGKIRRSAPLPPVAEDEIPFDIPDNWRWVRLGEICSIVMGQSPDGSSINKIDGIEFHQGKIFFGDKYIADSELKTSAPTKIASANSILLCVRAPVGKVNITDREICIGRGLAAIQGLAGITELFLFFMLQTYESIFNKQATGSTFKAITREIVYNQPFPLPPLAEQRRIVARLEELLPLIDALAGDEKELEAIEREFPDAIRKSLLQAAIEGKLTRREPGDGDARDLLAEIQKEKARLVKEGKIRRSAPLPPVAEDEIPFDIPDSWCWVRLGEIGSTHIGLTYKPSDVKEEGITVLRSSNIQDGKICLNDVVKVKCDIPDTKMCQVNDLLICARNGSKKLVGKAAIIQQEGFSFGAFMAIFRTPFYAYTYYLLSPLFRDDLEKVGTTTINQITHANLNMRMFPLPPLAEQRRIVARLEELLPLVDELGEMEKELSGL